MKRKDLIKRVTGAGWYLKRNGASHDVYWKDGEQRPLTIPRHTEIAEALAKEILKQAGAKQD